MQAMLLKSAKSPLELVELPIPNPQAGQVLLRVKACGVCRTDLHIVDGELQEPKLPLILGHQIVGQVEALGEGVEKLHRGQRIGVPWLGKTCHCCHYCRTGRENLCEKARFTGYHIDGGYAEYAVADSEFCFPLPDGYPDLQVAPLLCAGLIGYRSYRMVGDAQTLGFYGFGAAAHILIQVARHEGKQVYAFTRAGDGQGQKFALELGAVWAGASDTLPPERLDGAIIFAPAGELVPLALKAVRPGGVVVCAGIQMSDIPSFPYSWLWEERSLRSVANLTRLDGEEFLELAPRIPIRTEIEVFSLPQANLALEALRSGQIRGAAVLSLDHIP